MIAQQMLLPVGRHQQRLWLPVLLSLALTAACAHDGRPQLATAPVQNLSADDRLQIDDVLEIRVVGEAEMSGEYRVGPDGQIQFPYAGQLQVAGMRVHDVHRTITERLREEYLRNPQVAVHVKEWNSRKLSVLGEVKTPGPVAYYNGMTVVDAIAAAGGFTKSASMNSVKIRREVGGVVQSQRCRIGDIGEGLSPNVSVLPGDVVMIDERMF